MEHKLSKHQVRVLLNLAKQKQEAKSLYEEIAEAEQEVFNMITKYADFPLSKSSLKQVGEDVFLVSEEQSDENIESGKKE